MRSAEQARPGTYAASYRRGRSFESVLPWGGFSDGKKDVVVDTR